MNLYRERKERSGGAHRRYHQGLPNQVQPCDIPSGIRSTDQVGDHELIGDAGDGEQCQRQCQRQTLPRDRQRDRRRRISGSFRARRFATGRGRRAHRPALTKAAAGSVGLNSATTAPRPSAATARVSVAFMTVTARSRARTRSWVNSNRPIATESMTAAIAAVTSSPTRRPKSVGGGRSQTTNRISR